MKLYHYTDKIEQINEDGLLRDFKSESTDLINEAILRIFEELPVDRDYCIYLSFDKRDDLSCICEVDIAHLNQDLLFVAEEYYADQIYDRYMNNKEIDEDAKKYCDSMISFNDYIEKGLKYKKPEIIYLQDIPVKHITFIE